MKTNKNKPVLLCLHGFLGSHHDWDFLKEKTDYDVRAIDIPAGTIEEICDHLSNLIDTCTILGYSMGGRIAIEFAKRYPQKVKKLILESTSPGIENPIERQARWESDQNKSRELTKNFPKFIEDWYKQPLFGTLFKNPKFKPYLQDRLKQNSEVMAQILCELSPGITPSHWHDFPEVPTTLLVGENDHKYVEIAKKLKEIYPKIKVHMISDSSHAIHIEYQDTFAQCVV